MSPPRNPRSTIGLPDWMGCAAVAVILVLIAHFSPWHATGTALDTFIQKAVFGVEIFFVLSGFLITHLLLREEAKTGSIHLGMFYARRALRILPPLLALLLSVYLADRLGLVSVPREDFFAGLFFIRNYVGSSTELGHLWSLGIEEQYYLVWPLLLILIAGMRMRALLCVAVVVLSPFWIHYCHASSGDTLAINDGRTDFRLQPIVLGSLLALLRGMPTSGQWLKSWPMTSPWVMAPVLALLGLSAFTSAFNLPILRFMNPSISNLCVAYLINHVITNARSPLTRILELPPITWIGKLSYSLYLWQQPFSLVCEPPGWLRFFPWNLLASVILAHVSYFVVEQPFLLLRTRLHPRPK